MERLTCEPKLQLELRRLRIEVWLQRVQGELIFAELRNDLQGAIREGQAGCISYRGIRAAMAEGIVPEFAIDPTGILRYQGRIVVLEIPHL